jgi:hypothetical protein
VFDHLRQSAPRSHVKVLQAIREGLAHGISARIHRMYDLQDRLSERAQRVWDRQGTMGGFAVLRAGRGSEKDTVLAGANLRLATFRYLRFLKTRLKRSTKNGDHL